MVGTTGLELDFIFFLGIANAIVFNVVAPLLVGEYDAGEMRTFFFQIGLGFFFLLPSDGSVNDSLPTV